jgi:hypothetical protein
MRKGHIRSGGPSGHTLTAVGGAATGAAARHLAPAYIAEIVSLADDLAEILPEEVGEGRSLETPKGRILIGTAGDDRYRIDPDIVLILDPGGGDTYEFSGPVVNGQLTIVDLSTTAGPYRFGCAVSNGCGGRAVDGVFARVTRR